MKNVMFADRQVLPILGIIVVCTLPHFFNISLWSILACLFMWGYIFALARYSWRLPGRTAKLLLSGILFLIAMGTNEGFTIEAFVALLALMICMKLLDIRIQQNRMTVIILCYFLIVGSLFFDDSIYATTYMLFAVVCTTAALIHVNRPGRGAAAPLKLSFLLTVQALPIMILMFLLFPRIHAGGWGRAPISMARTGFSDRMGFGDLASMAQNTGVAFRVEFDGAIPAENELYWRGVVLWEFDGRTWYRGRGRSGPSPRRSEASRKMKYTLTLEPHDENWLITLNLPMQISQRHSWLLSDFSCYTWRPVSQRISYTGVSFLDAIDVTPESSRKEGLELPEHINPRTRALAAELMKKAGSTREYINLVLDYFHNRHFIYTLKPPSLLTTSEPGQIGGTEDLVDRFMFVSRKGFCEHYATAFAFLMRAAGVPARVVVGYLGGTLNQYGGYLVVRQTHAHAWCEVWIQGKGWVRIDPTTVVAPSRLQGDVAGAVPEEELGGLLSYFRGTPLEPWVAPVAGVLDLVDARWNKWVMGYSTFEQTDLFSHFGIQLERGTGPIKALISALVALAVVALAVSLLLLRRPEPSRDQLTLAWVEFCHKLAGIGLKRKLEQGPVDYLDYVLQQRPDLDTRARPIVELYVKLRYGTHEGPEEIVHLQRLVKQFQPGKTV